MRKWFQKFSPDYKRHKAEQAALETFTAQPLDCVREIRFFKRDEITSDLICCEIEADDKNWFFHEEMEDWAGLLDNLKALKGYDENWMSEVIQPPFETCLHVAYRR